MFSLQALNVYVICVCKYLMLNKDRTIDRMEKLATMQISNTNGDDIFAYLSISLFFHLYTSLSVSSSLRFNLNVNSLSFPN